MHAFLLRLIQRKIFEAMTELADIEAAFSGLDEPITDAFLLHCRCVHQTYLRSLQGLELLLPELLNPREILLNNGAEYPSETNVNDLSDRVLRLTRQADCDTSLYLPLQFTFLKASAVYAYTGIAYIPHNSAARLTVLYESRVPMSLIHPAGYRADALTPMLEKMASENNVNLTAAVRGLHGSFRQLQADSKAYYGDTFYRTLIKIRILNAVSDLLFTDLSYKEIAYRNHFTDYNNMYRSFRKYGLRPGEVQRLMNL